MKFISKLRCALKTSYKSYYAGLQLETLKRKRKSLKNQYFVPILMWVFAISIMVLWVRDISQVVLFSGVVIPTAAGLYDDYKKRRKCIDRLIEEKMSTIN